MNKFKTISTAIFCLGSYISVCAQDNSYVSMSEADLISLSNTLRKHRKISLNKSNYEKNEDNLGHSNLLEYGSDDLENKLLKQRVIQLQNQLTQSTYKDQSNNNYARLDDVLQMEQQIWKLQQLVAQIDMDSKNRTEVIDARAQTAKPSIEVVRQSSNDNTAAYLKVLESKLDSLALVSQPKEEIVRQPSSDNTTAYIKVLEYKLDSLALTGQSKKPTYISPDYTLEFDDLKLKMSELKGGMNSESNTSSNYLTLKENYKNYNQKIFFENNSIRIDAKANLIIDELYTILNSNETIDVVVKGFASNKGKLAYNEKISMERTESVKKALLTKGIHPTRILTQYHGIDYISATVSDARRVEVSVLVRK